MPSDAWTAFSLYAVGLLALGMLGGWAARSLRIAHTILQMLLSLVGGLLLGVACLHLLPHSIEAGGVSIHWIGAAFLAGITAVYLTLRFLDGHGAHVESEQGVHAGHTHGEGRGGVLTALSGFGIHGVLDGLAVAAAVAGAAGASWPGLAAIVAIAMHKPMDTFMAGVLLKSRCRHRGWLLPTLLLSLATPVSAAAVLLLVPFVIGEGSGFTSLSMAFGAGVLLCVALADVLPEVRFHGHDRLKMGVCLLFGIALAGGVGVLESSSHNHDHSGHDQAQPGDGHANHDHPDHD